MPQLHKTLNENLVMEFAPQLVPLKIFVYFAYLLFSLAPPLGQIINFAQMIYKIAAKFVALRQ